VDSGIYLCNYLCNLCFWKQTGKFWIWWRMNYTIMWATSYLDAGVVSHNSWHLYGCLWCQYLHSSFILHVLLVLCGNRLWLNVFFVSIFPKIEDCEGGIHLICRAVLYLIRYGVVFMSGLVLFLHSYSMPVSTQIYYNSQQTYRNSCSSLYDCLW
jgi:hypothetical protein